MAPLFGRDHNSIMLTPRQDPKLLACEKSLIKRFTLYFLTFTFTSSNLCISFGFHFLSLVSIFCQWIKKNLFFLSNHPQEW